jgi:hypothetical protein
MNTYNGGNSEGGEEKEQLYHGLHHFTHYWKICETRLVRQYPANARNLITFPKPAVTAVVGFIRILASRFVRPVSQEEIRALHVPGTAHTIDRVRNDHYYPFG